MITNYIPFNLFPVNIKDQIFECLSVEERFKCRIVCKQWQQQVPFREIGNPLSDLVRNTNILTIQIFHQISKNQESWTTTTAILQQSGILSTENIRALLSMSDQNFLHLAISFKSYKCVGIPLTQENFNYSIKSLQPDDLLKALMHLREGGLLMDFSQNDFKMGSKL